MSKSQDNTKAQDRIAGLIAQYDSADALRDAAIAVRESGYSNWDCHSPFPVHGLDRVMGVRPTVLPWFVLAAGIVGGLVALAMQWWTNAIDYPMWISGKPLFSLPANIPVTFELVVLFSALTAFLGAIGLSRLPRFWHPTFSVERFVHATNDRFFVSIEASDPKFDERATRELLESTHAEAIEMCHEPIEGHRIPTCLYWLGAIAVSLALLPPLGIAVYRAMPKSSPRVHLIPDMDDQPSYQAQASSTRFADGRASRSPIPGTVAVGQFQPNEAFAQGRVDEVWVEEIPIDVTQAVMDRGQKRFEIFCAACHGLAGDGDGIVARRAAKLATQRTDVSFPPPSSLHNETVRNQPVGQLFNTITHGVRNMPSYGSQIPIEDRWAIVHYVRDLQQNRQTIQP